MKMTTGTRLTKLGAPEVIVFDHGFVFAPFHAAWLLLGAQDMYGWNLTETNASCVSFPEGVVGKHQR